MATSDAPLSVPNVTLAVARGGSGASSSNITGTGFGSKFGSFQIFEDFESIAVGGISTAPVGDTGLRARHLGGLSVEAAARDGSKCLVNDFATTGDGDFPQVNKTLSDTSRKGYLACWLKRDIYGTISSGTPVWKFARVNSQTFYSGDPQINHEYTGTTSISRSSGFFDGNGNILPNTVSISPAPFPENTWIFYELEFDWGTPGGADGLAELRMDGAVVLACSGQTFLLSGSTRFAEFLITPFNGMGRGYPIRMWMDDIYIDESRARVVMTDNAVYADSTKWAVQPIDSYSDTEVSYTPKRQDFSVGETAYLHLFNDSGALVKTTDSFLVGAD